MSEAPSSSRKLSRASHALSALGPLIGLVAVCVLFAALQYETFVSAYNFSIILQQTTVIAIAALGMTLIIVSGGIDLSAGSVIALASVITAILLRDGWPAWAATMAGIAVGGACGAITGTLITGLRLIPFVVTLGMMGIVRGAAKGIADEQTVYPDRETWLNALMPIGPDGGIPIAAWAMLALAILVALALRYTRFGRHDFAIGSNELTARLCGVRVERVKIWVYVLGGAFAGLGGVLQFSYITVGDPTGAVGLELNIIAAVVIGGASLSGGQGTIAGTLVGALFMSVVANGCTKIGWDNWVQEIVTGVIIILAALFDQLRRQGMRG